MRLRTAANESTHVRYGNVYDRYVEFPPGTDELTVGDDVDRDTAIWAEKRYTDLELVEPEEELRDDYAKLQQLAAASETDEVNGNSTQAEIVDWLDSLDDEERSSLIEEVL